MNKSTQVSARIVVHVSLLALLTLAAPIAYAGGGGGCHFHGNKPADKETVMECAVERRDALIKGGKIDATWKSAAQDKLELVDGKKGKEWKVSFKDGAAKDKSKEALYMFFTASGNFIAANFTGQ